MPLVGDAGFGDQDRSAGYAAGEVIEWIAIYVEDSGPKTSVTGLEIKYRNWAPLVHGLARGRRVTRSFDLARRETVTSITFSCDGPASDKHLESLIITTNLKNQISGGKPTLAEQYIFAPVGKQVVSFRGYVGHDHKLKTLGLQWARAGYGKW